MIKPGQHQLEVPLKFIDVDACIIGDSMGVGKTLSAVLLDFADRKKRGWTPSIAGQYRTLIVCQKNGMRSAWRYTLIDQGVDPDRILVIDPKDREEFEQAIESDSRQYDYFICHWDFLVRSRSLVTYHERTGNPLKYLGPKFDHVIGDEIQFIKNRNAKRTKIFKKIKTERKTGCSGTPADDKPQDFWSILNWLYPKEYSSYWRFFEHHIEWEQGWQGFRVIKGTKNIREFQKKISPFYIRRTLPEVVADMPEKVSVKTYVDLTSRQLKDYNAMAKWQRARVGEQNQELLVTYKIAMHMRLLQMTMGTIDLDWDDFNKAWERYGHLMPYTKLMGKAGIIHDPSIHQPKNMPTGPKVIIGEPSPKLDALMEDIGEAYEEGENYVCFTNFTQVAELIKNRCLKEKIPVSILTGSMTNQAERDASVADFQSRKTRVFCGTIGAAGTTITLTASHLLTFVDRHWNPSKNEQATDRIYRLGQKKICRIKDIIADDTVDDPRLKQIWEKGIWVKEFVDIPVHLRGYVTDDGRIYDHRTGEYINV